MSGPIHPLVTTVQSLDISRFMISKGKNYPPPYSSLWVHSGHNVWSLIWNLDLPDRVKIFIWKCLRGILPVRHGLNTRMPNISPVCPLCDSENETVEHLFCSCSFARSVWNGCGIPSSSLILPANSSFKEWLLDRIICLRKHQQQFFLYISTLWSIWKHRNQHIFSSLQFNPDAVLAMAKDNAQWFNRTTSWLNRTRSAPPLLPNKFPSFIIKPFPAVELTHHSCILHVDGAWKNGNGWCGLGFTASLSDRSLIAQISVSSYSSSPLQTELFAIHEAVTWSLHHNFNVVYIRTDCFNAVCS